MVKDIRLYNGGTIGADPEIFIENNAGIISAHGMVEGTKEEPQPVEKGALQVDGTALEFNINPTVSPKEFQENLVCVLNILERQIGENNRFSKTNTYTFPENVWKNIPEDNRILGCEPELNCYTGAILEKYHIPDRVRTVSGHIHVGIPGITDDIYEEEGEAQRFNIVKNLDATLGLLSLCWDDMERKKYYGDFGACRLKEYGVEYRVLGNHWLFDPILTKVVYHCVNYSLWNGDREFDDTDINIFLQEGVVRKSDLNYIIGFILHSYRYNLPYAKREFNKVSKDFEIFKEKYIDPYPDDWNFLTEYNKVMRNE